MSERTLPGQFALTANVFPGQASSGAGDRNGSHRLNAVLVHPCERSPEPPTIGGQQSIAIAEETMH
jgi:hypothetical protein